MLLLHNSPEFVFSFLGASHIGAIITTANPLFPAEDIAKQVLASKCNLIITESKYVEKIKDSAGENRTKIICTDTGPEGCLNFSELLDSDETKLPEVKINPDDPVALIYSSGTTGLPKGVLLTHKGLITSVAQQVDGENPNLYLHSDDVIMCVLPLFHILAINSIMLCGLRAGSAILIVNKFEISGFLGLIEKYKVTFGPFVPPILLAIAKSVEAERYDLSSVRIVMSGAAPLGKELQDAVSKKLQNATIAQGYGMTEAGPVVTMCLSLAKEPFKSKSGSCGSVVRNAQMKIVDPDSGISLGRNQKGEICVKGDQIMKGYLNNEKATEEIMDKDGWLHTGDIGYIDEDDEVFIVDRLKELIKYKGFQVAPAELEAMLINHPNISDAAVVSIKDEVAGELPVAFIVRANGSTVSEDDIKQYIKKQVVFYKKIHHVFFVDAIPKSPSGKILRKELRLKLAANIPVSPAAPMTFSGLEGQEIKSNVLSV